MQAKRGSSELALEVKNLSVELSSHKILDNLTFQVEVGSTTAIIGPNGAGKSILLKAILHLIPKTSGEVKIFGVPHERFRDVVSQVSYIPQHLDFEREFPLTVEELFALKSKSVFGMKKEDKDRMEYLLHMVGMSMHHGKQISQLSGGQLQRMLIAYSLMDTPRLLILDEPSAGIDVQGQETMYALLKRIQKEEHLTMILVSHELDVVMEYADQVLCLNTKLVCAGVPRKVLTNEVLQEMYSMPVGHFLHNHSH